MQKPSKGNTSSSSCRSPSSSPQRFAEGEILLKTPEKVLAVGNVGPAVKKRKASESKDPSPDTPTCRVCNKTFSSVKAVHGHMRIRPKRKSRGNFNRSTFSPSSKPPPGATGSQGEGSSGVKKRKVSGVKVPRTGTPTCRVCKKTFSSWKGVDGHMRMHPRRTATPSSSSSKSAGGASQVAEEGGVSVGQVRSGEGGPSSPVQWLVVDHDQNQPIEGAADPAEEGNVDEGNKIGFDLNEFPACDD